MEKLTPDKIAEDLNLYTEERLKQMLDLHERDITLTFFVTINQFAKQDIPIPKHWIVTASQLLIDAAKAKKTNSQSSEVEKALCINNYAKGGAGRDVVYATMVAYFISRGEIESKAFELTLSLIKTHTPTFLKDAPIGKTQLRTIYKKYENTCLENGKRNMHIKNYPEILLKKYLKFEKII